MTDAELVAAERAAYAKARGCPIYTGNVVSAAVKSARTSAACADEWMRLRAELLRRGLIGEAA